MFKLGYKVILTFWILNFDKCVSESEKPGKIQHTPPQPSSKYALRTTLLESKAGQPLCSNGAPPRCHTVDKFLCLDFTPPSFPYINSYASAYIEPGNQDSYGNVSPIFPSESQRDVRQGKLV